MTSCTRLHVFGCLDTTRYVYLITFAVVLRLSQNGTPLKPQQVFEDVSADHANKTVTIEPFPHSTSLTLASVHPCKHASVMRKVIERMNAGMIEEQRKSHQPGAGTSAAGAASSSGGTKK